VSHQRREKKEHDGLFDEREAGNRKRVCFGREAFNALFEEKGTARVEEKLAAESCMIEGC